MKVNKYLLPIKAHYFFFMSGNNKTLPGLIFTTNRIIYSNGSNTTPTIGVR